MTPSSAIAHRSRTLPMVGFNPEPGPPRMTGPVLSPHKRLLNSES